MHALLALSPVDGRYAKRVEALRAHLSEYGLIKARVRVEVEWLIALADEPKIGELIPFTGVQKASLRALAKSLELGDAEAIKTIEGKTNHDVKAVEYWIKAKLSAEPSLQHAKEFVHFALTSEDVNNLAYAIMLGDARDVLSELLDGLRSTIVGLAHNYADASMLARTHGQAASPTTMGKELANVAQRLQRQLAALAAQPLLGKLNGATGNFNAHLISYPEVDWPALSARVIEALKLEVNTHTTQIEPHDWIAELCDCLRRIGVIGIDFCRDVWGYISLGYFKQALVAGEVGSSTMPHKVNPIDFENAEGNFGLANALFGHFSEKLPISRWQRDLSDSTVLRALGSAFGHMLVAIDALARGIAKLELNPQRLDEDLAANPEVLAEAIQTVMRRYGLPNPYERLKALTRGARIDDAALDAFVESLELSSESKARLKNLRPHGYIGLARELAKAVR
jgi:adenylosuccinate lyase